MDTSNPPPTEIGDSALWESVRSGDADAFAHVFDRHHARVHRHARRWSSAPHDADDLVAAVFLEAWRRRQDVTVVDGSVLPWLLATANNILRNRLRSEHRGRGAFERMRARTLTTAPDHADAVAAGVDAERRAEQVRRAFLRLDPLAQDVLTLCVLEGLPMAGAAEALGCPVGTVKSRLSRARRALRGLLEDMSAPASVVTLRRPPARTTPPCPTAHLTERTS